MRILIADRPFMRGDWGKTILPPISYAEPIIFNNIMWIIANWVNNHFSIMFSFHSLAFRWCGVWRGECGGGDDIIITKLKLSAEKEQKRFLTSSSESKSISASASGFWTHFDVFLWLFLIQFNTSLVNYNFGNLAARWVSLLPKKPQKKPFYVIPLRPSVFHFPSNTFRLLSVLVSHFPRTLSGPIPGYIPSRWFASWWIWGRLKEERTIENWIT